VVDPLILVSRRDCFTLHFRISHLPSSFKFLVSCCKRFCLVCPSDLSLEEEEAAEVESYYGKAALEVRLLLICILEGTLLSFLFHSHSNLRDFFGQLNSTSCLPVKCHCFICISVFPLQHTSYRSSCTQYTRRRRVVEELDQSVTDWKGTLSPI